MAQDYIDRPMTAKAIAALRAQATPADEFDDRPRQQRVQEAPSSVLGTVADVGIGALKGAGRTAFGLGKMVRDYTPIGRISDAISPGAFDQVPPELEPSNTAQRVGFTAEQVGEFFTPAGIASKAKALKTAVDIGKSGLLTMAQSGSPTTAATSMGITAAVPGAGAAVRAGKALKEGAKKTVVQALAPTKEWAKVEAARIAPQMLERGIKGSREAMLSQAGGQTAALGQQIDDAVQAASAQGVTVAGQMVIGAIKQAKQSLTVPSSTGAQVPIEGTQAAVRTLNRLEEFVDSLGPDIPIERANQIKKAWQKIVSKAGFYGPKASSSATDNAKAWATREAEKAMRTQIAAESPQLAALNQEFAFWKGLKDVLTATEMRKQGHGAGLTATIGGIAGASTGYAQGDSPLGIVGQMLAGGIAGRQVIALMQSPQWRTMVSAPLKDKLADALLSGKAKMIEDVSRIVVTSLPARLRPQP